MKDPRLFSALLQGFFTQRLMQQKQASPHTIASYRDTFRLLLCFANKRLHKSPSQLAFDDVDAPFVAEFLNDLEKTRQISARSRNLRLTAIRSFFQYAGYETPSHSAQIQRVLAIPSKRYDRTQVRFLSRPEIDALLQAPDVRVWSGRRDQLLLLIAIQTGLRLSELTQLTQDNLVLDRSGSHIRCLGKGRKERCTPLTKQAASRLQYWLREPTVNACKVLFPSARGQRLSGDGVRHILAKHIATAAISCPSLGKKRVTPHMLRHTMAMELLQAGVDRAVIALWLGHESVETTQIYLEANLALKEKILQANPLPDGPPSGRYRPDDDLLAFLSGL
jgi:site-specific recombinase XerD